MQHDLIAGLKERFAVSENEMETAKNNAVLAITEGKMPSENPMLIIIGGQVGSRKEELKSLVSKDLKENILSLSIDDLRKYHPHYQVIRSEYPDMVQPLTADFTRTILANLEDFAIQQPFNIMLDATLSNSELVKAKINKFKQYSFEIALRMVAIHKLFSYLNAEESYEKMLLSGNDGNLVSKQYHDQNFEEIGITLQKMDVNNLFNIVQIYKCETLEKEDFLTSTIQLLDTQKNTFIDSYLRERNRDFTDTELIFLKEKALQIKAMKKDRDAYFLEKLRFDFNVKSLVENKDMKLKSPKLTNIKS